MFLKKDPTLLKLVIGFLEPVDFLEDLTTDQVALNLDIHLDHRLVLCLLGCHQSECFRLLLDL